jgi:hypothetical protein
MFCSSKLYVLYDESVRILHGDNYGQRSVSRGRLTIQLFHCGREESLLILLTGAGYHNPFLELASATSYEG